jgi:WD40 repeat protein
VARIFDTTSGKMLHVVTASDRGLNITSVDFNQDGTRLVTGSVDGKVMVWDPVTGQTVGPQMTAPCVVMNVKFNPDGARIAAGCYDSTAHLFDTSTGQEMFSLPGFYVDFSPDGWYLLTQSVTDLTTRGFYLDVNDLIALAQQRLLRGWTPDECQKFLQTQTCPPAP